MKENFSKFIQRTEEPIFHAARMMTNSQYRAQVKERIDIKASIHNTQQSLYNVLIASFNLDKDIVKTDQGFITLLQKHSGIMMNSWNTGQITEGFKAFMIKLSKALITAKLTKNTNIQLPTFTNEVIMEVLANITVSDTQIFAFKENQIPMLDLTPARRVQQLIQNSTTDTQVLLKDLYNLHQLIKKVDTVLLEESPNQAEFQPSKAYCGIASIACFVSVVAFAVCGAILLGGGIKPLNNILSSFGKSATSGTFLHSIANFAGKLATHSNQNVTKYAIASAFAGVGMAYFSMAVDYERSLLKTSTVKHLQSLKNVFKDSMVTGKGK